MSDALAIARNPDGTLASSTRKKILYVMTRATGPLSFTDKQTLEKWLGLVKQPTVVTGTPLYTALQHVNAVKPIY